MNTMHTLFVFDFDWTVVNCNSDEYVPAQVLGHDAASDGFRDLIRKSGTSNDEVDLDWHKCVEIMVGRAMNEGGGATPGDVLAAAARMPFLDQVKMAITEISEKGERTGQMILSDGNTLFIEAFLQANDMEKCFDEGIMTNIGEFVTSSEEEGGKPALKVTHQSAKYGGHNCPRCARSPNLCKTSS